MRRFFTALLVTLFAASAAATASAGPSERTSIVDAALAVNAESGEFDELIEAVLYTGLLDTLDGNRQFTVFAPTDAAFEALYGVLGVSDITEVDKALVTQVLLYHVAPGERFAADVLESDRIRTMAKQFASISTVGDDAFIDNAKIVATDIDVDNGVIHVIDAVILPSS